jgi:hypothetical protein
VLSLPKSQRRRFIYRARYIRWRIQDIERVWSEGAGLRPPPGRRERRRLAKLRRRRALREARKAARAFLLALPAFYGRPTHREIARIAQQQIEALRRRNRAPGLWRALAMSWIFKRESQRLREMTLIRGA